MKKVATLNNLGVKMPIARAVSRILVLNRNTGESKIVRIHSRVVDQWRNHDFPMSVAQAERFLRSKGIIDKNGMIVIEY